MGPIVRVRTRQTGVVTAYLREYDPDLDTHREIGQGSVYVSYWQAGESGFVKRSVFIPEVEHTISDGHKLELFLIVENEAKTAMWFAYDTVLYPSVIKIP